MTVAADIARGLTKAQRKFVLGWLYVVTTSGQQAWLHDTTYSIARMVAKKGLGVRVPIEPGLMATMPSALGHEVRAILLAEERRR